MIIKLIHIILILTSLAYSQLYSSDNQQGYSVNEYGLKEVQTIQKVKLFDTDCVSYLQFGCPKNNDGTYSLKKAIMEFKVSPVSKIQGFNFRYFEGPRAPSVGKNLMSITVIKGKLRTSFRLSPAGWFSGDIPREFAFGIISSENKSAPITQILNLVLSGAESIEISITDGLDPSKILTVTFPVTAEIQQFNQFMMGID